MITPDLMREWAATLEEIAPEVDTAHGRGQVSTYGLCVEALREGADEIERLRSVLAGAARCQLLNVNFDPMKGKGYGRYGVEVVLKSGSAGKLWRAGNYLLIPVDHAYEPHPPVSK